MSNKDELVNNIKQWIATDKEMKDLSAKMKKLRDTKKTLSNNLVMVMRENEIDCFDVKDGKMLYTQRKVKAPLNKKTLLSALEKFYSSQSMENMSEQLTEFILDTREETVKESIRLKGNN